MKRFLFIILICQISLIQAQVEHRKLRVPVWITHDDHTDIIGLSLGAYPRDLFKENIGLTRTFGIRLEVFPLSPFYFLAPRSPVSNNDKAFESTLKGKVSQQIFGINLSTGTFESIDAHGISITGFIHYSRKNNGMAIAGIANNIERLNGLAISPGGNRIYKARGVVIGGVYGNSANYFSGIQLGGENYILEKGRGVQIGLFNKATNFKGIQLGLWNKNQKRNLPIINWNFK